MRYYITILLATYLLGSCEYENIAMETLSQTCDTAAVQYNKTIKPLIREYCYSCHSTAAINSGGGLDLEDFASFKNYLKNTYRGDGIYGSQFYHCITKQPGALPMPPGNTKFTDCELLKIKQWIDQGAPDN